MERGYCPHCNKIVRAKREDLDILLIIILAIFTAGIGVAIYLAIFYSKYEKNLCVKCNHKLKPITGEEALTQEEMIPLENPYKLSSKEEISEKDKFFTGKELVLCPFCGQKIEPGVKVCPNCHSLIEPEE